MIMQLYLEMAVFVATPFSHTLAQNKILPLFHPKSKHKKKSDQWLRSFYDYSTHQRVYLCSLSHCALLITLHGPVFPLLLSALHLL